jgi:chaperonin GroEL
MTKKIIKFGTQARKSIQAGVNTVVDAVQASYGPAGRNVVIQKSYGSPEITNDGVTIAKAVELEGFEQMGVKLIVEAANKTNEVAGDGTSLTSILAGALINEGIKVVESGSDPVKVKKGMQQAANFALEYVNSNAKVIKTVEEMTDVATISSRSKEIGTMIAELIQKVGKDGVVTVSDGESNQIETDLTEGMQFDKGYKSPYFVTDTEKMEAVANKPHILVTDQKVTSIQDVLPLIEALSQSGKKELVIIADDIEGEALATFVVNKIRGIFSIFAVQAPAFGDRRKAMLEDIAVLTGATFISSDLAMTLKSATITDLGTADKVVMTKDTTTVVGGKGDKNQISHRIETLKTAVADTKSDYDREKIQERVAKLTGGVAVIKVGASTEVQMKELKFQVEDAVNATKAAVSEGVIAGGASTLIRIAKSLETLQGSDEDETVGINLFRRALIAPFRAMAKNSGLYDISILVNEIEQSKLGGYDFAKQIMREDMFKSGIIDPALVLKQAIANSTSIASSLITTEVAMVEEKQDAPASSPSPDMGGMGGMGF